jgi:restriction endonuclease Mrr
MGPALAWVRTYLKKAGLADNSARGVWSLTDAGEKISDKELLLVPKKVRWLKKTKDEHVQSHLDGEEDDEPDWQEQVLSALSKIKPDAFERLCQRVLRESGLLGSKLRDGRVTVASMESEYCVSTWFHSTFSSSANDGKDPLERVLCATSAVQWLVERTKA